MVFFRRRQTFKRGKGKKIVPYQDLNKKGDAMIINKLQKQMLSVQRYIRRHEPELKVTTFVMPYSASLVPATTFVSLYPTAFATVDLAPGLGSGGNQRIGDAIRVKKVELDIRLRAIDSDISCRVVMFKWKDVMNPDTVAWDDPTAGTVPNNQEQVNVWFPARSTELIQVLYQKVFAFRNQPAVGSANGEVRDYHIRKVINMKDMYQSYQVTSYQYPVNQASSTLGSLTSYKNCIYFLVLSDNLAASDVEIAGSFTMSYIDA